MYKDKLCDVCFKVKRNVFRCQPSGTKCSVLVCSDCYKNKPNSELKKAKTVECYACGFIVREEDAMKALSPAGSLKMLCKRCIRKKAETSLKGWHIYKKVK